MAELNCNYEIEEFKKLVAQFTDFTIDVLSKQQRIQKDQVKLKREMKINKDLMRKSAVLQKKVEKYDSVCNALMSSLSITDSDKQRLHLAKEIIEIAKQYTGIRWDYSAPDGVTRGYIKNRSKMMLETFDYNKTELSHAEVVDKLWKLIETSSTLDWSDLVIGQESS